VADELLSTKLNAPPARKSLVARPRLTKKLNAGLERKLTLVSAPAGFGKTTLLAHWVQQTDIPTAWVSLDETDNELFRFLSYFVEALITLEPNFGGNLLARLKSAQQPTLEPILTSLLNEISGLAGQHVQVLDDVHLISDPRIHSALAQILDQVPENFHLFVITRTDPPLPLSRMRAANQLIEVRADDLRFKPQEAASFFNEVMGLGLSPADVSTLERRTEGWAVGLQLAALTLQGHEDAPSFIRKFAGHDRFIVDYLGEEVLERQSQEVQEFLLRTSILKRLTGALCDVVVGTGDGQAMLEALEEANLFVFPLDNSRRWYRYHPLFADFLTNRLENIHAELIPVLHHSAAEWLETADLKEEALEHAFAGGDFKKAAILIEDLASRLSIAGPGTVIDWYEKLPEDLAHSRPLLSLSYAMALVSVGRLDAVEPQLMLVERWFDLHSEDRQAPSAPTPEAMPFETVVMDDISPEQIDSYRGKADAIRSVVACYRGIVPEAVELSYQALELLPESDHYWRGVLAINIALNLSGTYGSQSDVMKAVRVLAETTESSVAGGDYQAALFTGSRLAYMQVLQGRLTEASETYREAIQLASEFDERGMLAATGLAYVGLGGLLYERNRLEKATKCFLDGVRVGEQGGDPDVAVEAYQGLARVEIALGDLKSASDWDKKAQHLAQGVDIAWIDAQIAARQALLQMARGDRDAAAEWAMDRAKGVGDELGFKRESEHLTLARVLIGLTKNGQALEILEWLLKVSDAAGLTGIWIESLALKSEALDALDQRNRAMLSLEQALNSAEPEGYVRTFIDSGEPMMALLNEAVRRRITPGYAAQLLEAAGDQIHLDGARSTPSASTGGDGQPLEDALSGRELEVLRLISAGLPNREIAEELVITEGTVKAHAHRIYSKLSVHNRTEAVARARDLNLLS
jgi:ATP/maltotriose-dependent transcriptional regulator MalT